MTSTIEIDGRTVSVEWNQGAARRFGFRAAKHGIKLDVRGLFDPARADSAYVEALWLMLPPDEHARHATPEDLAAAIDHKTQADAIVQVVLHAIGEMTADAEKKTTSKNTPSPGSSLASRRKTGTGCTPKARKRTSKHGKKGKTA
jgi:hypothetical protein